VSDLVQRFARIAREQPGRVLIYAPGHNEALTAQDVWRAHLDVRARLSAAGVGHNQLILSAAGNHAAAAPLLLACLAIRAPLLLVDAGATVSEIAEFARRFGAAAVVLPERAATSYGTQSAPFLSGLHLIRHDGDGRTIGDAAVLKLTSGSTGLPRATLTTEGNLIADGEHIIEGMGIRTDDIQTAVIPLSHSYGLGNLIMPLLLQGTALVLRESFGPHELLADARRFHARVFPGVPYMFSYFAANPPPEGWPPDLQLLISAGSRLDLDTMETFQRQFRTKLHSFYGTSETGGITYDAGDQPNGSGHVGAPLPGVSVTPVADEGAPPRSGRILVRSRAVTSGYLQPEAEHEGEQENPFLDGGFLTGDYGFVDRHGHLTLTGRASTVINVAGRKVHPTEVERVLLSIEGVDDACVFAAPDARRGQQVVACVISRHSASAMEVRRHCAARLAPYKVPRAIVFLPSLPLTGRGKIDHARLLTLALECLEDHG
jgi:acyl-CoA synthetase (AMP-forming)/AMP-acid ligase II